jgi:hypothetical protein
MPPLALPPVAAPPLAPPAAEAPALVVLLPAVPGAPALLTEPVPPADEPPTVLPVPAVEAPAVELVSPLGELEEQAAWLARTTAALSAAKREMVRSIGFPFVAPEVGLQSMQMAGHTESIERSSDRVSMVTRAVACRLSLRRQSFDRSIFAMQSSKARNQRASNFAQ